MNWLALSSQYPEDGCSSFLWHTDPSRCPLHSLKSQNITKKSQQTRITQEINLLSSSIILVERGVHEEIQYLFYSNISLIMKQSIIQHKLTFESRNCMYVLHRVPSGICHSFSKSTVLEFIRGLFLWKKFMQ
jgi:hypothetical protein